MGRRESVTAKANTMEQPNVITDAIHIEAVLSCSERPCSRCKKDVLVMHPGPINRGVEITSEVADGPHSAILQQVANGVAIRMAVMYLVAGARGK